MAIAGFPFTNLPPILLPRSIPHSYFYIFTPLTDYSHPPY